MHTQICKNLLKVNRATPNNSCRAELGQYPLLINIQKRAIKFHQHLKCSDPSSYQAEALQWQEQKQQKSALLQLVLKLHPNQHTTLIKLIQTHFMALPNADKLRHILGENSKTIATAARYVSACHKLRLSASGQT